MNILGGLSKMLRNHPIKSIVIVTVVIILLVIGVKDVFMATGNDTLVKSSADVYQDNLKLEEEFGGESIIVLYESDNLLTPSHLEHMKGIENLLQTKDSIYSVISPVTLVEEVAKKQFATFQDGLSDIVSPGLPKKQTTLDQMIYENGKLRSMFKEVVIGERHMIMMIKFNGRTSDVEKSDVVATINTYLDTQSMDSIETIVTGKPVLDSSIRSSMQKSIQQMMGLALLIMVVILLLFFKSRWRLLPLLTVLIAVIGTIGLMGWIQIPITMVSMAVFPILIGLGIDYAIQFQTRYTEEMAKEDSNE